MLKVDGAHQQDLQSGIFRSSLRRLPVSALFFCVTLRWIFPIYTEYCTKNPFFSNLQSCLSSQHGKLHSYDILKYSKFDITKILQILGYETIDCFDLFLKTLKCKKHFNLVFHKIFRNTVLSLCIFDIFWVRINQCKQRLFQYFMLVDSPTYLYVMIC